MLKNIFAVVAISLSTFAYADCEISDALKNKSCGSDYFLAKSPKQLNEYLQYGKFKNGQLLNLEIGFNIRGKEIDVGTTCDLKLQRGKFLRASLNGVCLQGRNIYLNGGNILWADRKAPINLIANESVKTRMALLQTGGELNISTSTFNPFDNEVLISRDSKLVANKINITTPSNLIINSNSNLRSPSIILNGGSCEVGDNDDRENDHDRDRGRFCRKFNPRFTYTGTCSNNPIPATLKISSVPDKADSLKLTYSITGAPTGSSIKWKFDDEIEFSTSNAVQSFLFPGRHLAEAVVSSSNGYFRKLGSYNNVSPNKFNKGQMAIFQFKGLKHRPSKVMAFVGLRKFMLKNSSERAELYSGEIPKDSAGNKIIFIPELGYKGNFNLVILPTINNPSEYINTFIDSIDSSLEDFGQDNLAENELATSLSSVLSELKAKINLMSVKDQASLAARLQANTEGISNTVTKSSNLDFKFNLLNLLIPTANAQSLNFADRFIPQRMREYAVSDIISTGVGITATVAGIAIVKYAIDPADKIVGGLLIVSGLSTIYYQFKKRNKIIIDLYDFIGSMVSFDAVAGEVHTIRLAGAFIPVSANSKSTLLQKSRSLTNEFNNSIAPINESLSSINSLMSSVGLSNKLVGSIPTLAFPTKSFQSSLSSEFISDVQLTSSEYGDVSLKSVNKVEDGVAIQFTASRSQNATIRIFYKNNDFNIYVYKDVVVKITVAPKAVINYTKNNLQVNFDSTDPENPNVTGLTYSWNFGDGQTGNATSQTLSHNYSVGGTYNVSLTVTDSFGASDTASVSVVVQGASNLTICNGGKVPITMSFTSPAIPSFTLEHINHYRPDGSYISSTCECKEIAIPQNTRVGIHVEGSGLPDWLHPAGIIPYDGYIYAQPDIQYFTMASSIENNQLYYVVFKGEAYGAECQDYTYK